MKRSILISLAYITIVSSIGAWGWYAYTADLTKSIGMFLMVTCLQLIVGYITNTYITEKMRKEIALAENQRLLAELDKIEGISTILNCAYCSEPNVKSFIPDEDADFICDKCNNKNTVVVQFSVARITTPVNSILSEPQQTHNIKL